MFSIVNLVGNWDCIRSGTEEGTNRNTDRAIRFPGPPKGGGVLKTEGEEKEGFGDILCFPRI